MDNIFSTILGLKGSLSKIISPNLQFVINSSPIIFLVRLQALELFLNDNYEFYITPSVVTEINAKSDEISRAFTPVLAAEKLIVQSINLTSLFN